MRIPFTIHASSRLVTYAVEGDPSPEEARSFLDAVQGHPDFVCGFNFLGDYRGCTADPGPSFVRGFAREIQSRAKDIGPCRWAFVMNRPGGFAAVRVISMLAFGSWVEFGSFMSMEVAAEWVEAATAERSALVSGEMYGG